MDRPLVGRSILIVEDEPLIALDIQREFEAAGARVVLKRSLQSALVAVEEDAPSAAILDHALPDGDSSLLCGRLKERNVLRCSSFSIRSRSSGLGRDCLRVNPKSLAASPCAYSNWSRRECSHFYPAQRFQKVMLESSLGVKIRSRRIAHQGIPTPRPGPDVVAFFSAATGMDSTSTAQ
jgi:hypothetical protein